MQVNVDFVKSERQKRAWSQEQLAATAALGLRTVQRLESSGVASNETVKSLAAVLECSVPDLLAIQVPPTRVAASLSAHWKRPAWVGGATLAMSLAGILLIGHATAREVMLEVVLGGSVTADPTAFKLLAEEGKQAEAGIDGRLKLLFTPTLQGEDLILVALELYGYDGKEFKLLAKPKVLTRNGNVATVQVGLADGRNVQLTISPKKL